MLLYFYSFLSFLFFVVVVFTIKEKEEFDFSPFFFLREKDKRRRRRKERYYISTKTRNRKRRNIIPQHKQQKRARFPFLYSKKRTFGFWVDFQLLFYKRNNFFLQSIKFWFHCIGTVIVVVGEFVVVVVDLVCRCCWVLSPIHPGRLTRNA